LNQAQLETFLMISKHKSYSKAAEVLHITQPTVTSRIKSLEKGLDCKLFKRIGHDISLTKQGLMFVEYAENILTYMEHSKEITNITKAPHIKVGFSPGYSYSFIVEILSTLKKTDDLSIEIIEGYDSVYLNEMMAAGDIDLIFTREVMSRTPEIASEYLFENNLVALLSSNHYLSQKKNVLLEDLKGETILSFRRNTVLWNLIDKKLMGAQNLIRVDVDNNEMLKQAVASEIGIGIIPMLGVHGKIDEQLVSREIEELTSIPNSVYVQYRKNNDFIEPAKKIIYSIINHKHENTF